MSRQEHGNCSVVLALSLQMDVRQDTLRHFKWHLKLKLWHSNCFLGGTETQNINFCLLKEKNRNEISVSSKMWELFLWQCAL